MVPRGPARSKSRRDSTSFPEVVRSPWRPVQPPSKRYLARLRFHLEPWRPVQPFSKRNLVPLGPHWRATWRLLDATWAQLALPSRTPSATWRLLGSTWPSKPHSKFNLALLGSIFGALATLRIELSPRRELNSHGSGIFAVHRSWTAISYLFGLNLDLLDAS